MKTLSDAGLKEVARRFQVLGDPGRLRILDVLRRSGEQTVGVIAARLGCSVSHASRQLAVLHEVGFVARRRDRTTIHYVVADPAVFELCGIVCGRLEQSARREPEPLFLPDPLV